MNAVRKQRYLEKELESTIGIKGVREEDEFIIEVFQERKKQFKLNRIKYRIKAGEKFSIDFIKAIITLPIFPTNYLDDEILYELKLVYPKDQQDSSGSKSRYLMTSLSKTPFRINGIYAFEAFVERGDVIDIGLNRLNFQKTKKTMNDNLNHFHQHISDRVIRSRMAILLEGETGTGKTSMAKKIHELSEARGRFVHINISALTPNLVESELFGHVKGAFTGAISHKLGAFAEAHKGTLFLDEIDSLSLDMQTKLLLFLDNYEIRPVGGAQTVKVDVRVIFASGSNLKKKVESEFIRKDFYYRLENGCRYTLLPLREDRQKIIQLCYEFERKEMVQISEELIRFYSNCSWPGNIRQLISHLKKKVVMSKGPKLVFNEIDQELIHEQTSIQKLRPGDFKKLEEIKIDYSYNVYLNLNKNMSSAATILGISVNTLKSYVDKKSKELGHNKVIKIDF